MPRKPIETSEGETAEAPGAIPKGVQADVTVKYRRTINPDENQAASDLDQLALEADEDLAPPDLLAAFLQQWSNFIGYNCELIRLPDPADRRMPSNHYARPNFGEVERLGGIPFDPINFVPTIQMVNGNSGGVFRCWLTDNAGQMIPAARLDRFAIADPPGAGHRDRNVGTMRSDDRSAMLHGSPAPYKERELSAAEKQLTEIQGALLQNALDRMMNPDKFAPPPPPPVAPQLPDEDRLALMLFKQGELMGPVIQKMIAAVQAPDVTAANTWKNKAMDYVMQNPQVGMQIAGATERVITGLTNLLTTLLPGAPQIPNPPATQHAPAATPNAQAQANQPPPQTAEPIDAETEDEEDMAMLDEIVTLLSGTEALEGHPVFEELQRDFPKRFPMYVNIIARTPSADTVLEFVSKVSPLYEALINGPMRAHYQARAEELRQLCIKAITPPPAAPSTTEGAVQ